MKAYIEVKSQKSRGSSGNKFGGPDTYVAVQVVPDGQEPLQSLNRRAAERRGIQIIYCGEGYSRRCKTPRSSLRQAIAKAESIAKTINATGSLEGVR